MCLDACCCSIPLELGCLIIGVIILLFRISTLAWVIQHVHLDEREELTVSHIVILLIIIGSVIPIFLMCGAATRCPFCVGLFVTLEILFVIAMTAWDIYFITNKLEYEFSDIVKKYKHNHVFLFVLPILLALEIYFLVVACSLYNYLTEMRHLMPQLSYGRRPVYYI